MKKSLLLTALCALLSLSAAAQAPLSAKACKQSVPAKEQGNLWYGYCDGLSDGLGTGGSAYLAAAIEIPAATAASFANMTIDAVRIGLSDAAGSEVKVFLTTSLSSEPFYTQTIPSAEAGWITIELDSPYTVTGSKFYVGYVLQHNGYPIGMDGVTTSSTLGDNLAVGTSNDITAMQFQHYGTQFGNLCIEVRLSGDFPAVQPVFLGLSAPSTVAVDKPFVAWVNVKNMGAETLTSALVDVAIDDAEPLTRVCGIETPAALGETSRFAVDALSVAERGTHTLKVTVKKVNDTEISPVTFTTNLGASICSSPRRMVVEEGTGTWCGFCPRGIVALENMKRDFPDTFIGIAAHNGDAMEIAGYAGLGGYISGYPGCQVNRNTSYPTDPDPTALLNCYNQYFAGETAEADVKLEAEWYTVEHKGVKVKASTMFGQDKNNAKYRYAFVLLENNVGPYVQSNNYAGGSRGEMGGWETYGSAKEWLYDDVARWISNYNGNTNSFPTTIVAGEEYTYEQDIPTTGLTNKSGQPINVKSEDIEVVALVLCTSPRSIVNAIKIPASEIAECTTGLHAQEIICEQEFEQTYAPGTSLAIEAVSTQGLPLTYEIVSGANYATIEGNVLTFTNPGTVKVKITQPGNETCLEAVPMQLSFVCKYDQAISWDQDLSGAQVGVPFELLATASSGLKVTYKLKAYNRNVKISGSEITFNAPATVTIQALQTGNTNYAPAETIEREMVCEESGIDTIGIDEIRNSLVFDLGGARVENPAPGQVYIVVRDLKASKVLVK